MNAESMGTSTKPEVFPYKYRWPVIAGAAIGIIFRLAFFGNENDPFSPMMVAFILFVPFAIGVATVFIAEKTNRRTWGYYVWAPILANTLFVAGTLMILVEGIICAILILPLFAVMGAIGGLIAGVVCRNLAKPQRPVYGIAMIPLVLGAVEHRVPLPMEISHVERALIVDASPEQIWSQLVDAHNIRPGEIGQAWMYRIGVPLPVEAVTETISGEHVRHIVMGKGIHFDQVATVWEPNRRVVWAYRFAADSFPPRALDDHVRIGGKHFDLLSTEYSLTPTGVGTELRFKMEYRVSTRFNWYARPLATLLVGNFGDAALGFYAGRAVESTGN